MAESISETPNKSPAARDQPDSGGCCVEFLANRWLLAAKSALHPIPIRLPRIRKDLVQRFPPPRSRTGVTSLLQGSQSPARLPRGQAATTIAFCLPDTFPENP